MIFEVRKKRVNLVSIFPAVTHVGRTRFFLLGGGRDYLDLMYHDFTSRKKAAHVVVTVFLRALLIDYTCNAF